MPQATPADVELSAPRFSFPAIGRKKVSAAFCRQHPRHDQNASDRVAMRRIAAPSLNSDSEASS